MVRKLVMVVGVAVLGAIAIGTAAGSPGRFEGISEYDLQQLGLDIQPIGDASPVARVLAAEAVSAARDRIGSEGLAETVPEVARVMARPRLGAPLQSAWIVVFRGGDVTSLPWGPYSEDGGLPRLTVSFSGALVDDQTGDVLVSFRGGHQ